MKTQRLLLPLSKGASAVIDELDFELLSQWKWSLGAGGYATRGYRQGAGVITVRMHRVVAGTPAGMFTDHINGNRLDNRRANLRICTLTENNRNAQIRSDNTTGYKGVCKSRGKWVAAIFENGRCSHLGYFQSPEEAAIAYNSAAVAIFGEFAHLNAVNG